MNANRTSIKPPAGPDLFASAAAGIKTLTISFDGSRRPEGWIAYGIVAREGERQLLAESQWVRGPGGRRISGTSNEAELHGLIAAIGLASFLTSGPPCPYRRIVIRGDSQLAIGYMTGDHICRSARLRPLYDQARSQAATLPLPVDFIRVPREENRTADRLLRKPV